MERLPVRAWAWGLTGLALLAILLRSAPLLLLTFFLALIAGAALLWLRVCLQGVTYHRRFGSTRLFHGETTDAAHRDRQRQAAAAGLAARRGRAAQGADHRAGAAVAAAIARAGNGCST